MVAITVASALLVALSGPRTRALVVAILLAAGWWLYIRGTRSRLRLVRLTLRDPLTGLYNRRYLTHRLGEERSRLDRHGGIMALAVIDLDNFKTVNDRHGHLYGDKVLRDVGVAVRATLRKSDVAFRFGGEEFVVLFPDTRLADALAVLKRLQERLRPTSFSGGVAECPTEERDAAALLHLADMRLAAAKRAGKGRIQGSSSI